MESLISLMTIELSLLVGGDNPWYVVSSQLLMVSLVVNNQDAVNAEGEALGCMVTVCLMFWGDNNHMDWGAGNPLLTASEALQKENYILRAANSQLKTYWETQRASLAGFKGIPISLVLPGLLC